MQRPRRFPRRRPWNLPLWAAIILAGWAAFRYAADEPRTPVTDAGIYRVERVADGDTLVLAGGQRVRLIGVNSPEVGFKERPPERWAAQARAFTRSQVEGRAVTLEFDRERRDQYDRLLAYVYRDGWFLNEELLRAGMAKTLLRFPYSPAMKRRFQTAERSAREAGVGIWSTPEAPGGAHRRSETSRADSR